MMDVMDHVNYDRQDFNLDPLDGRHPFHMTEQHFIYHLYRDENSGFMYCTKNAKGRFVMSPRSLSAMCTYKLVTNTELLKHVKGHDLPSNLYPGMLTEAIYQREVHSIEYLVSTWPTTILKVYDTLPLEDYLESDYLTKPLEGLTTSILDCFMLGLLNLKPESRLKFVDFTGFDKDRVLCRELLRLPIIWLKPENRSVESIFSQLSSTVGITKDKVERYINRIGVIYSNFDCEFTHGNDIGAVTILLDCKMTLDDVPIGLALQSVTPFRFVCNRLWVETIPDVSLELTKIPAVLRASMVTHMEVESQLISHDIRLLDSLLSTLGQLPNLTNLGLPGSIDTELLNQKQCAKINKALQKLHVLDRLNLSSCNLHSHVEAITGGMRQPLSYLNLRDCRLAEIDLWFLLQWRSVLSLRELNLSRNCLKSTEYVCHALIDEMPHMTCFSVSYCQLTVPALSRIARHCINARHLKVLSMQSFVPPSYDDLHDILYDCVRVTSLQKCVLLPAVYAFPGNNEEIREHNKQNLLKLCYRYIQRKSRQDMSLE